MCDSSRIFPVFSGNLLIELIFWLKYYILLLLDFFHEIFERKHKLLHTWLIDDRKRFKYFYPYLQKEWYDIITT